MNSENKYDIILLASVIHELNLQDLKLPQISDTNVHHLKDVKDGTRKKINSLYSMQVEALKTSLKSTIEKKAKETDSKIRFLDIGCGIVPYANVLKDSSYSNRLEIDLWDKDDKLEPIINNINIGTFCKKDILEGCNDKSIPFLDRVFRRLKSLLNNNGILILAEFYYPCWLSTDLISKMVENLQERTGHGDPASVFFHPDKYCISGCNAGLLVEETLHINPMRDRDLLNKRLYCIINFRNESNSIDYQKVENQYVSDSYFTDLINESAKTAIEKIRDKKNILEEGIGNQTDYDKNQIANLISKIWSENDGNKYSTKTISEEIVKLLKEWLKTKIGITDPDFSYMAIWCSLSSNLWKEFTKEDNWTRFDPTYSPDNKKYKSYSFLNGNGNPNLPQGTSESPESEEWSSIAYNNLLFPQGEFWKKSNDEKSEIKISGPSIYESLKNFKEIRSILFTCPFIEKDNMEMDNNNLEKRIRYHDTLRNRMNGKYKKNHLTFNYSPANEDEILKAGIDFDEANNLLVVSNNGLNEEDNEKLRKMIQTMMSVFLDFIFISKGISNTTNDEDYWTDIKHKVCEFKTRWLSNSKVVYILTLNKIPENNYYLPDFYKKNIENAIDSAYGFIERIKPIQKTSLPNVWLTVSLDDVISSIQMSSIMFFSDILLDVRFLDYVLLPLLQKPLIEYYAIENEVIKKNQELKIKQESIKSAIAAIMSRNMSHNLGSHVISGTKNYLVNHAFETTKGDNKGVYRLLQYFQERMDFVAVICNSVHNHYTFNAPLNLKADILDEFAADGRDERHPSKMTKNEYTKSFLLDYIVRSEQVYRNFDTNGKDKGIEIVLFRKQKDKTGNEIYLAFTSQKNGDNNSRDFNDINFSVPLGINSRHAFLTIVENFIRNSAKHNHYYPDEKINKLLISILIEENDNDTYTVKIFDNKEDKSGYLIYDESKGKNLTDNSKTENYIKLENGEEYYKVGEKYYFKVEKEHYNNHSGKKILKLQNDLENVKILDASGAMDSNNKGIKEMLICSAWLQNKNEDWSIVDRNKEEDLLKYYSQNLSEIRKNLLSGQDIKEGKTEEIQNLLDESITALGIEFTLPKHRYVYCLNIDLNKDKNINLPEIIEDLDSADFYIAKIIGRTDDKIREISEKIKYALPKVIINPWEIQQINGNSINVTDNAQNNSEEVLLWCYRQLNLGKHQMLINYQNKPEADFNNSIIHRENGYCIDTESDKIRLFISHNDSHEIFAKNYAVCNQHYGDKMLFMEGISGASFNYNLLINAGIREVDYYKIIHACDAKIAIIDERLFDKYKSRFKNITKTAGAGNGLTQEEINQVESDINAYRSKQKTVGGFDKTADIICKHLGETKDVKTIQRWIDTKPEEVDNYIKELKGQLSINYSKIWLDRKNIFIYNVKQKEYKNGDPYEIIDFENNPIKFSDNSIHYLSIHYSIISKYAQAKNMDFNPAFEDFLNDIGINYLTTNIRITVHSGRGGVAEIQKKLPFVPVSMIDSQLEDCKYKLAQLFLNMKYKRETE